MKIIQISNMQFVPAHNIDMVMISQDDPKQMNVYTTGGRTISCIYPNEDLCRQDYERIFNELKK